MGLKTFDENKVFDELSDEDRPKHDANFFWELAYQSALSRSKALKPGPEQGVFIEGFIHGIMFSISMENLEEFYDGLKQRERRVSASIGRDQDDQDRD